MSSRIDTLEPNDEPLAVLLASIVARISSPDFIEPRTSFSEDDTDDIARHAQRAIAGVPLGVARARARVDLTALRSFVGGGMAVGKPLLAAAAPVLRRIGAQGLHKLRGGIAALRPPLKAIAKNSGGKVGAGLALATVGLALVITFVSGRHGPLEQPSNEAASAQAPPPSVALAEERPLRDSADEFTRANLRYCTFQQIRLGAVGPITEGADLVVFNALVDDWNGRCANHPPRPEDKEAVDAEAAQRRALLEVEGRALMNVWRRKVVTTVQQRPTGPGADTGDATATAEAGPEQTSDVERLPLLITQGRATADESDRAFLLKSPALALLRGDVAIRVQRRLNDLGYTIAPLDGTWGPVSRMALRRFKKANGLLDNDAFDAETVTRLFATSAVKAPTDQRKSDETVPVETIYPPPSGADMNPLNRADGQRIQQRLAELGYYGGRKDAAWDAASRAALRRFRAANSMGNSEEWDAQSEVVLFDEQAVRADAGPSNSRKAQTPPLAAAVPLPPKRPPPPAKSR